MPLFGKVVFGPRDSDPPRTAKIAESPHGRPESLFRADGGAAMLNVNERVQSACKACPFLTTKQAAYHLGLAVITLRKMRADGRGPRCRMHGRTWRYHIDDIESWSIAHASGERYA